MVMGLDWPGLDRKRQEVGNSNSHYISASQAAQKQLQQQKQSHCFLSPLHHQFISSSETNAVIGAALPRKKFKNDGDEQLQQPPSEENSVDSLTNALLQRAHPQQRQGASAGGGAFLISTVRLSSFKHGTRRSM